MARLKGDRAHDPPQLAATGVGQAERSCHGKKPEPVATLGEFHEKHTET